MSQAVADSLARINERLAAVQGREATTRDYVGAVGQEILHQVAPAPPPPPPAGDDLPWWLKLGGLGLLAWASWKFGPNVLKKLGVLGGSSSGKRKKRRRR